MAFVTFPEPTELAVPYVQSISDSKPKSFNMYSVENPHPGFGTDPNILNELGHSKFPMWVDSKLKGERVVVNSQAEYDEHASEPKAAETAPPVNAWPSAT